MESLEEITKKKNRINKTEPKSSHSYWCDGCDRQLIRNGQKCPICGFRDKTKHRKI